MEEMQRQQRFHSVNKTMVINLLGAVIISLPWYGILLDAFSRMLT